MLERKHLADGTFPCRVDRREDDVIGKVEQNGGRVVQAKRVIPGIGWFATCAEPGGLLFGVLQPDSSAS